MLTFCATNIIACRRTLKSLKRVSIYFLSIKIMKVSVKKTQVKKAIISLKDMKNVKGGMKRFEELLSDEG